MNETYDEMYTGKEIILLRWENREFDNLSHFEGGRS